MEVTIPDVGITSVMNALNYGLYMAVASDANEGAPGDTGVAGEIARNPITVSVVTPAERIRWQCYFTSAQVGGASIHKAAIFDAETGGSLVCQKLVTLVVPAGQGAIITLDYPVGRA